MGETLEPLGSAEGGFGRCGEDGAKENVARAGGSGGLGGFQRMARNADKEIGAGNLRGLTGLEQTFHFPRGQGVLA